MAGKLTNNGALYFLSILTNGSTLNDIVIHLYKNDFVPDEWSDSTSFEQADFQGYSPKQLFWYGWENPHIVNFGYPINLVKAVTEYYIYFNQISWTCGPIGGDVYGYYAERNGTILFTEYFNYKGMSKTDVLRIRPYVTMRGLQP